MWLYNVWDIPFHDYTHFKVATNVYASKCRWGLDTLSGDTLSGKVRKIETFDFRHFLLPSIYIFQLLFTQGYSLLNHDLFLFSSYNGPIKKET